MQEEVILSLFVTVLIVLLFKYLAERKKGEKRKKGKKVAHLGCCLVTDVSVASSILTFAI